MEIAAKDLPETYRKADVASGRSQKLFLAWSRINFAVLALAAMISSLKTWMHAAGAVIGAALLASGAVMSFWLRKSRYERQWYRSRAVAESVKTLSWRYMMCASPFEAGTPQAEADAARLFDKFVHDIADQEAAPVPRPHEITDRMREVRRKSLAERVKLYLTERIEDQREWYAANCEKSEKNGSRVLYFAVATQVIACAISLILITSEIPDFTGAFATLSASALAWMQLKKYEDVAQAYSTAAKELSRIGLAVEETSSDAELSRFVLDAENAISREHTLWLAKRT